MLENRIKTLREKKGLSQKQLAALVGTSQQQIQRIETGKQSIRFDLSIEVCRALEAPMQTIFPQTKKALTRARRKGHTMTEMLRDRKFEDQMEEAGVDMDISSWFFEYRLRGGAEGVLPVSSREKNRLWHVVQRSDSNPFVFVVFDSEETEVVLNLNHLIYCHFVFYPPNVVFKKEETQEDESERWGPVSVYLADSAEPLHFDVEPDHLLEDPVEDEGQFRFLTVVAASTFEDDTNEVFSFTDVDGETAFFRAWDVAMIQIPLPVLEPKLLDDDEEEEGVTPFQQPVPFLDRVGITVELDDARIAELYAQGWGYRRIAGEFNVSFMTIKRRVQRLQKKANDT